MRVRTNSLLAVAFTLAILCPSSPRAEDKDLPSPRPVPPETELPKGSDVILQFWNGGSLPVTLLDKEITINVRQKDTDPDVKMTIPVKDIKSITFRSQVPCDKDPAIDQAIANLSVANAKEAKDDPVGTATKLLLTDLTGRYRMSVFKKLKASAKTATGLQAMRINLVLTQLTASASTDELNEKQLDSVELADRTISGKLTAETLKASATAISESSFQLKMEELLSLRASPGSTPATPVLAALPLAPLDLTAYKDQIGQTFTFQVIGAALPDKASIKGTGVYTLDSPLATVAVHAGVVKIGDTGVMRVKILNPQLSFNGSVQNGVTSTTSFGSALGFVVLK